MIKSLTELLQGGYSPFENPDPDIYVDQEDMTIEEALNHAFLAKKNEWKESTAYDIGKRKDIFIAWLKDSQLGHLPAANINKRHIAEFLNHISKTTSNRSVNNYKSALSALFTKLVDDDILPSNVILSIKNRKTIPKRHKPYSAKEIEKIKAYLLEHDQYLYYFICFVAYGFLRNREVCQLRVGDIDTNEHLIKIQTKTSSLDVLRIIKTLQPIVEQLELHKYKKSDFVFTPQEVPGQWDVKERDKVSYFGKRFRKLKKALGLDMDHTIYSMRHTFAVDLYHHYLGKGLSRARDHFGHAADHPAQFRRQLAQLPEKCQCLFAKGLFRQFYH